MPPNPDLQRLVQMRIEESVAVKLALLEDGAAISSIAGAARDIVEALQRGRKILSFGNGGSAADAQHIAAELVGRFQAERPALPAIALTVNTSCLTAIANDYSFDQVFARQLEALAVAGDVALGISTSGNSSNVVRAIEFANARGLTTIGLSGKNGGNLKRVAHRCICAPSDVTPRIQEIHILVGHILCEIVEQVLFSDARISANVGAEV